jgi:hypothetical protein
MTENKYAVTLQMEPSKQSTERTPFKDLSNTISTSNGGEPTDAKERIKQQRRQRYAEMDKHKKEELLKKRRESYQQKKAKLQITPSVTATQESHGYPSALSQLQNTPALKGAIFSQYVQFMCIMPLNNIILGF